MAGRSARARKCVFSRCVRSAKRLRTERTSWRKSSAQIRSSLTNPDSAPYLLKEELRRAGSLVMEAAAATRVPAGAALAVDRHKFAELITERIENHPDIELVREEVKQIPENEIIDHRHWAAFVGCPDDRDHETHRQRSTLLL